MEKVKKIVRGLQIQVKQGKEKIANLEKEKAASNELNQSNDATEEGLSKEELSNKIIELEKVTLSLWKFCVMKLLIQ